MISPNLAAVTAQIGLKKGGMPTLPSSPVAQQKPNPNAPKPGQKMENGLDIEMRFVDNYKKHKGTDPYQQYANVKMPDGSTKRVLAYDLGDGNNYIPQIHGPDFPFQSIDVLNKIPSQMDVIEGRFTPVREEPRNMSATGTYASRLQTNYMEPKDPLLAGFTPQVSSEVAVTPVQPGSTPPAPAPQVSAQEKLNAQLDGLTVNPKYAEAGKAREQAAGMANKVLRPDVTLESALPLIVGAILAGDQGASVLKGGVQGIEQATAMRQTESDIQTKAARDKLFAQAQGLEKTATEEDQIRDAKTSGLATIAGQETRVELQQLRNEAALERIKATMRGQDMTQINKLATLGPEGRLAFARQMNMSEEDAQALARMNPQEIQRLASADLSKARTADLKATLQPRLERMRAATSLDQALVGLTGLRKEGQAARNALDLKEFQWYDRNAMAKLSLIEAQTEKAEAEAQKAERELFYTDGSPRPMGEKGAMTETSYTTNWSKFQSAYDKADAEIAEKQALVAKMESSIAEIEKESKASAAKNPIMGADPGLAKKIQKLRDNIDLAESEIEGLKITKERNRTNMETLNSMKTGGAVHPQLKWYQENKSKMTPEDQAKFEAGLRRKGLIQ